MRIVVVCESDLSRGMATTCDVDNSPCLFISFVERHMAHVVDQNLLQLSNVHQVPRLQDSTELSLHCSQDWTRGQREGAVKYVQQYHGLIGKRIDGWMDGWRDEGMEGWRDGGMEGWRDGGRGLGGGGREGGREGEREGEKEGEKEAEMGESLMERGGECK